jgi:hypothetical protein
MLAGIEIVNGGGGLAQEGANVVGRDASLEIVVVDAEQVEQAAVGHFHDDDEEAGAAPNIVHSQEVVVTDLPQRLQRANFLSGGHGAVAGQEFESRGAAVGTGRPPNFAASAAPQKARQAVAGIGLHAESQRQFGFGHVGVLRRSG